MDLFRRALDEEEPSRARRRIPVAARVLLWRRLLRRVWLVISSAFYQRLSLELLSAADVPTSEESSARSDRSSRSRPSVVPAHKQEGVTWVMGPRLTDMKTKKKPVEAPETCSHPATDQQAGGNPSMYYQACLRCHARWQRIPILPADEQVEPPEPKANAKQATPAAAPAPSKPSKTPAPPAASCQGSTATLSTPRCPKCQLVNMVLRQNRKTGSTFWACRAFPECRGSQAVEKGTVRAPVMVDMTTIDSESDCVMVDETES